MATTAQPGLAASVTAQVAVAKIVCPAVHIDVVALGENPAWHALVQEAASAILLIPAPHGSPPPLPAPLVTATTAQPGAAFATQVALAKVVCPAVHIDVAGLGENPPWHTLVQEAPSAILVIPAPHGSAPPAP